MAELKTKPTKASVTEFLKSVDASRQADCKTLIKMMEKATGSRATMWGSAIIGFGDTHYNYASGSSGDWFPVGFSPRKAALTLYLMGGLNPGVLARLGKFKRGKGCLYISKLADVDLKVLQELIETSMEQLGAMVKERTAGTAARS